MTNIKEYMHDGANWQAQAVLACLRHEVKANLRDNGEDSPIVTVGRYENCREQGYVFTLTLNGCIPMMSYCVYEHRNSDTLCLQMFYSCCGDTPSVDTVFKGKRNKWDIDERFEYGKTTECGEFISEDMVRRWEEFAKNKEELGWATAVKIVREEGDKWYEEAKKREEEYENEGK